MDTQDPNTIFPPPTGAEGGIAIAETPPLAEIPPQPVQSSETIIVPAAGDTGGQPAAQAAPASNPFVPNVGVPGDNGAQVPRAGNPMIKRLLIFIVLALVLVAAVVVGKGFISKKATDQEVTLNYWGLWENDANVRKLIASFEATHPKIHIQYTQQSPKQYRERLQSAINRGEGPDAFRFHNTWVAMLHNQLSPVPPTVMTPSEFQSTFFQVTANDLVAGSTIFGIPMMIDGLGLYVNEDLFATAGVNVPATWTDVINLVPKLTVKNGSAIVTSAIALGTTTNVEHFSDILGLMFLQNGANLTNLTGTEAEQTLIFYRKFADPSDPMYSWSDGMDNSVSAFAAGRVAMILAPSWRAHDIKQLSPNLHFKIVPVPQLPGNTVAWASYWVEGVSIRSKNQAQAWEFVKYITSKEGAALLYTDTAKTRLFGEPYARIDLANTIQDDPYAGAYVKQAIYARSFPLASRTFDNGINDRLIQYITDAVNGMATGNSPTKVLETANAGFRQVLTSYGLINSAPATTPK